MSLPPKSLDEQLAALPRMIEPPQELWPQIEAVPHRRGLAQISCEWFGDAKPS